MTLSDVKLICLSMMQVLSRLLRSKNADDLQAANRLIKNLVKQVAVYYLHL